MCFQTGESVAGGIFWEMAAVHSLGPRNVVRAALRTAPPWAKEGNRSLGRPHVRITVWKGQGRGPEDHQVGGAVGHRPWPLKPSVPTVSPWGPGNSPLALWRVGLGGTHPPAGATSALVAATRLFQTKPSRADASEGRGPGSSGPPAPIPHQSCRDDTAQGLERRLSEEPASLPRL